MATKDDDPMAVAIRAEATAEAAMTFMVQGFDRIERSIEAMRSENSTQHAEGRQNIDRMTQGIHRRLDDQDQAREKLKTDMSWGMTEFKSDMNENMEKFRSGVQGALTEVERSNRDGRAKLHSRIDTMIWAALSVVGAGLIATLGIAFWLFINPSPVRLPIG